jgi:hypothetical protein
MSLDPWESDPASGEGKCRLRCKVHPSSSSFFGAELGVGAAQQAVEDLAKMKEHVKHVVVLNLGT